MGFAMVGAKLKGCPRALKRAGRFVPRGRQRKVIVNESSVLYGMGFPTPDDPAYLEKFLAIKEMVEADGAELVVVFDGERSDAKKLRGKKLRKLVTGEAVPGGGYSDRLRGEAARRAAVLEVAGISLAVPEVEADWEEGEMISKGDVLATLEGKNWDSDTMVTTRLQMFDLNLYINYCYVETYDEEGAPIIMEVDYEVFETAARPCGLGLRSKRTTQLFWESICCLEGDWENGYADGAGNGSIIDDLIQLLNDLGEGRFFTGQHEGTSWWDKVQAVARALRGPRGYGRRQRKFIANLASLLIHRVAQCCPCRGAEGELRTVRPTGIEREIELPLLEKLFSTGNRKEAEEAALARAMELLEERVRQNGELISAAVNLLKGLLAGCSVEACAALELASDRVWEALQDEAASGSCRLLRCSAAALAALMLSEMSGLRRPTCASLTGAAYPGEAEGLVRRIQPSNDILLAVADLQHEAGQALSAASWEALLLLAVQDLQRLVPDLVPHLQPALEAARQHPPANTHCRLSSTVAQLLLRCVGGLSGRSAAGMFKQGPSSVNKFCGSQPQLAAALQLSRPAVRALCAHRGLATTALECGSSPAAVHWMAEWLLEQLLGADVAAHFAPVLAAAKQHEPDGFLAAPRVLYAGTLLGCLLQASTCIIPNDVATLCRVSAGTVDKSCKRPQVQAWLQGVQYTPAAAAQAVAAMEQLGLRASQVLPGTVHLRNVQRLLGQKLPGTHAAFAPVFQALQAAVPAKIHHNLADKSMAAALAVLVAGLSTAQAGALFGIPKMQLSRLRSLQWLVSNVERSPAAVAAAAAALGD